MMNNQENIETNNQTQKLAAPSKYFDLWNEVKKVIHTDSRRCLYHEREIWWCYLGINIGHEEDGKGMQSTRPVMIVKGFSREMCLTVPLTTSTKMSPYHVSIGFLGGKMSYAIASQVRLIDSKRLITRLGYADKASYEFTKKAIRDVLG